MRERLYRVLKPGIRQLVDGAFRRPDPGALINVSEEGAELLLREGFVELANKLAKPGTDPADGGIVSGPVGGTPAVLHGEEYILPLDKMGELMDAIAAQVGAAPGTPLVVQTHIEIPASDLTPLDETPGTIATVSGQEAAVVIGQADSVDELDRLEAAERASQRHPGGRTGVLRAIAARRQDLTATQAPKE
jgi:hypothetical protein